MAPPALTFTGVILEEPGFEPFLERPFFDVLAMSPPFMDVLQFFLSRVVLGYLVKPYSFFEIWFPICVFVFLYLAKTNFFLPPIPLAVRYETWPDFPLHPVRRFPQALPRIFVSFPLN